MGTERLDYLSWLPLALERVGFGFRRLVLVHATPGSNEDMVLPDADEAVARRVVEEAGAAMDDPDRGVRLVDGERGRQGGAEAGGHQALHRAVVLGPEHDPGIDPGGSGGR